MSMLKKLYDEFKSIPKMKQELRKRPYKSLTKISGVGFIKADSILLELQRLGKIDFPFELKSSAQRCAACMEYYLEENQKEGNTKMDLRDLRKQIVKLVPACSSHYVECLKDSDIYYNKETFEVALKMADMAIKTSAVLAKEYGVYPKYKPEAVEQSAFYSKNALGETKELVESFGLRNSQLLTIAPTGSLSTMIGVSGGIEPIFANYYTRKTESLKGHDEYYKVYTPIVKEYMDKHELKDDSELPDYFVTAQTLDYKNRIYMQSIWQSHIDASISSTVNVPNDFTVEQVEDLYMTAWDAGLKGVTIFRDGCKRAGILTTTIKEKDTKPADVKPHTLERGMIIKADDNCIGKKRTLTTGCGTLHCEAFFDPETGQLLETYFSKGSSGGCQNFMIGLSRAISLAARGGIDIYSIVDQLASSGTCPSYAVRRATKHDTSKGSSCPVAIGNALIDMYNEMQNDLFDDGDGDEFIESTNKQINKAKCPQCGGELIFEGGCNTCQSCGWSKCD